MLWSVESVPQLGDNEEVFPLAESIVDGSLDSLTGLLLIAVVTSRVEESVARLDGIIDGLSTSLLVHLPQSETNLWHLGSIVEN